MEEFMLEGDGCETDFDGNVCYFKPDFSEKVCKQL